jgi:hypothetical protein
MESMTDAHCRTSPPSARHRSHAKPAFFTLAWKVQIEDLICEESAMTMRTASETSGRTGAGKEYARGELAGEGLRPELAAYFVLPAKVAFSPKHIAIHGVLADLAFDRGCD